MRHGLFITLEGPEGSGKSSQGRRLVQALRRMGRRAVLIRDPGSTSLGRRLRQMLLHSDVSITPFTEALLFIGGRVALVEERIRPEMARGAVVVCDRFHDSTVAYQGFGGGVDPRWLDRLGRQAVRGVMPDLTIVLDLPVKDGFARLRRSKDRMERRALQFHTKVRNGYLTLARRDPKRITVLDARQSPETVRFQILTLVQQRLR